LYQEKFGNPAFREGTNPPKNKQKDKKIPMFLRQRVCTKPLFPQKYNEASQRICEAKYIFNELDHVQGCQIFLGTTYQNG
jgi:hypothetical protein